MKQLRLTEYETTSGIQLDPAERDFLSSHVPKLDIHPTPGTIDHYDLTPGSTIGALRHQSLAVEIRPKVPIDRVLFLLSYSLNPKKWKESTFDYTVTDSIVDAIIPAFVMQTKAALRRGLLRSYQHREDTLPTIRGRIRFADQIRKRFGIYPPLEVAFDEFTEDITENQLLKAATLQLKKRHIRSQAIRQQLSQLDGFFETVNAVKFHPRQLPEIAFTRLNQHYRSCLGLAELILKATSFELGYGDTLANAFLVDMNDVFEKFVITALREALQLTESQFPDNLKGRSLHLDSAQHVSLIPDFSWWEGHRCVFVGDVKYKKTSVLGMKHPDLYQMLAYTTATELPHGLLIYTGDVEPRSHIIPMAGKEIETVALDISGTPQQILEQVSSIADRIREKRFHMETTFN